MQLKHSISDSPGRRLKRSTVKAGRRLIQAFSRLPRFSPRWRDIPYEMVLAFTITVILASAALAQDKKTYPKPTSDLTEISIEDLMKIEVKTVYGASKFLQKVTEAPASVSIITADEIQKHGYRTLADILRSVRGLQVNYDRNYSYIGVRGFGRPGDYNTRILLLVNGHRTNETVYDSAYIGTEFSIDVDLIDRVEVIRGPGSSLYGTNAFFGVINVITKRGRNLNGPAASVEASSSDTYKARFSYGAEFRNGLEMLLSGSFYDSRGPQRLYFNEFDNPGANNGIAENADYDNYSSFFADLSFRDFSLSGSYVSRKKGIPTASFGAVFDDSRSRTLDRRGYLVLQYQHTFDKQWEVMAHLSGDSYGYDGTYVYDYSGSGTPPFIENKDFTRAAWWGLEGNVSKTMLEDHRVTLGSEYRDNLRQDQSNYDADPFSQYLNVRQNSKNWAIYVQDAFRIRKGLLLNAGVRHDHYETFGGATNPRLGLIYSPREKTTVKLLYGQAFRAPNSYELYYQAPGTKSNPLLKPETIKTTEVVIEHYSSKHLRVSASGFYNRIGGLINQQTDAADGLIQYANWENLRGKGLELELEGKWSNGLAGRIAYTLQDSRSRPSGDVLSNSPKHLGKFNLIVPLASKKLFAGLEAQYTSKRRTVTATDVDGFLVANATLFSQKLVKGLGISASIYNLFDKRYADPGAEEHRQHSIPQDARSFRVKISYSFDSQR